MRQFVQLEKIWINFWVIDMKLHGGIKKKDWKWKWKMRQFVQLEKIWINFWVIDMKLHGGIKKKDFDSDLNHKEFWKRCPVLL